MGWACSCDRIEKDYTRCFFVEVTWVISTSITKKEVGFTWEDRS
jgi:hypothetical protein